MARKISKRVQKAINRERKQEKRNEERLLINSKKLGLGEIKNKKEFEEKATEVFGKDLYSSIRGKGFDLSKLSSREIQKITTKIIDKSNSSSLGSFVDSYIKGKYTKSEKARIKNLIKEGKSLEYIEKEISKGIEGEIINQAERLEEWNKKTKIVIIHGRQRNARTYTKQEKRIIQTLGKEIIKGRNYDSKEKENEAIQKYGKMALGRIREYGLNADEAVNSVKAQFNEDTGRILYESLF